MTDIVFPASVTNLEGLGLPTDYDASVPYAALHAPAGSAAETYLRGKGAPCDNEASGPTTSVVDMVSSGVRMSFLVKDGEATLYQCSGTARDQAERLAIPASVEGVPVTRVGLHGQTVGLPSFVISLEVPGSVAEMGEDAFRDVDHLRNVTLGEGLRTIGDYAFFGCSLETLSLPEGVEHVGNAAFANQGGTCDLTQFTLPSTVRYVGSYAFEASEKGYERLALPSGLENLGYRAFGGTILGIWPIPRLVEAVPLADGDIVLGPNLKPFSASNSLAGESGPTNPFAGIQTTGFSVDERNASFSTSGPLLLSKDGTVLYACAARAEGSVTVPDGVTQIAANAFEGCKGVTEIELPGSLTTIGDGAFFGCEGLTELTLPASIETIGYYPFGSADYLDSRSEPIKLRLTAGSTAEAWAQEYQQACAENGRKNMLPYDVV